MWLEQDGKSLTGTTKGRRGLVIKQLSIARIKVFRSGGYLLVHSSPVGVGVTALQVEDFLVLCGFEPIVSGIVWLRSK